MTRRSLPSLIATLRRLADELGSPLSSVLLAAHAKVLAALSGEREVADRLHRPGGRPAVALRADDRGRVVARAAARHASSRVQLLPHADFPMDELRRELGMTGPAFETVFDPTGSIDGSTARRRHRACGWESSQRTGDVAGAASCGIGRMCWMRIPRRGSPAITSRRWS